jgi:hypothetical protein
MKTANLTGAALDWAVAKCEGKKTLGSFDLGALSFAQLDALIEQTDIEYDPDWTSEDMRGELLALDTPLYLPYSTDWAQGGPIIEREGIPLEIAARMVDAPIEWGANCGHGYYWASTPLIAAMRAYVQSKLGDEIDVPKELT